MSNQDNVRQNTAAMPDIRIDSLGFTKEIDTFKRGKGLQRSRTYAGSSTYGNRLSYFPCQDIQSTSKNSEFGFTQNSERIEGTHHDENFGVEDNIYGFNSKISRGSGLYPRVPHEEDNRSLVRGTRLSISSNFEKSFNIKSTLSNSIQADGTYSSNLNTIKDELNIETIIDEPFPNISDQKYIKHSKYTSVDTEPTNVKLLDDDEPLNLSCLSNSFVPHANPFFQTKEFSPYTPTDTSILLKILSYEFELIPDEVDSEDGGYDPDHHLEEKEKNNTHSAWYDGWIDLKSIKEFLNSYKTLSVEEYKKKYPWDQFYDPELFYSAYLRHDEERGLNLEMIPNGLQDSVSGFSTAAKREYSYLSQRKGF